jgi:DNA-binding CsgD family transcriptional regulator
VRGEARPWRITRLALFFHDNHMHLTQREKTVLESIVRGMTDRQISVELDVAISTARKHRENLLEKFQVGKSAELVIPWFALVAGAPKKTRLA